MTVALVILALIVLTVLTVVISRSGGDRGHGCRRAGAARLAGRGALT